ncbi:leucine-rich repeat-containing protein [Tanacetum coccineum]
MASTPMLSILLILSSIIIPSFSCPVHQKQALLHFKSSLTSIYNSKYPVKFVELDSWNPASDCCSYWERVNCSRTGSVTELQLFNVAVPPPDFEQVPISSNILTPLFHMQSLELFDIEGNYLEGEIPGDGFGNLTKLVYLNMWYNNFNSSIPRQLFQLTNLRYLTMSYNYLDGVLSPEVGKLRNLESLYLHGNSLSGNIPKEIGNLTNLRDLGMRSNLLEGKQDPELGSLQSLSFLDISYNGFRGPIPPQMFKLKSLLLLDLSQVEEIRNLTNLRELAMSNNLLQGQIPHELFELQSLQVLDLSNNTLEGKLGPELGSFLNLTTLRLSQNSFQGPIPDNIFELKYLRDLDLSDNKFGGAFFLKDVIFHVSFANFLLESTNH